MKRRTIDGDHENSQYIGADKSAVTVDFVSALLALLVLKPWRKRFVHQDIVSVDSLAARI